MQPAQQEELSISAQNNHKNTGAKFELHPPYFYNYFATNDLWDPDGSLVQHLHKRTFHQHQNKVDIVWQTVQHEVETPSPN